MRCLEFKHQPDKETVLHKIEPADYSKSIDFSMWFKGLPKATIL
jgi:hypothetical protein